MIVYFHLFIIIFFVLICLFSREGRGECGLISVNGHSFVLSFASKKRDLC